MSIVITKRPWEKVFSGNPVHYELYSALAASDSTVSFEVRAMFKKVNETVYTEVVTLPYSPTQGFATVDLKEILDSVLEFELPQFGLTDEDIFSTVKQTGNYYLQFREITSANPNPDWNDTEKDYERFVIKGGLNDFKYQGNNFWLNYFEVVRPFLTWQLSGTRTMDDGRTEPARLAAASERMYLAWLCNTQRAGLSLQAKVYYNDGTVGTKTVGVSIPRILNGVFYLPVGCNQLGLHALNPSKIIWYWTLQMIDSNDNSTWSEVFKYELDNRNDYIGITLNYRNSLGGLDSVRVRGSVEKKLDYNFVELEKTIEPDYFDGHYFAPQKIVSGNIEQVVYGGNIGLVKKEEQDRLRDAQQVRETWTAKGKKWVPMNILTKGFTLVKTDDQRWSIPIDFTLGYAGSEYYTPETVDLGEGVFTDNVCTAFISPLTVNRDAITGPDAWVLWAGEQDPLNASAQFKYRVIKDSDGSVYKDWEVCDWGLPIPFTLPNDSGTYTVQAVAICTNDVLGKATTAQVDSVTGGGAPPSGSLFSSILNTTSASGTYNIDIDGGAEVKSGSIGAHNEIAFDVTNVVDVTIVVTLGFSPALVKIETGGTIYTGILSGGVWTFTHVTIVDGIRIQVY
jgi:hypothetical protein